MPSSRSLALPSLALAWALTLSTTQAGCDGCAEDRSKHAQFADSNVGAEPLYQPSPLKLTPRAPGPLLPESAEQLKKAQQRAERWTADLLKGGLARREVASMADIRGHRLFRRRAMGRALRWFNRAAQVDPTYEPALFNTARAAALLGQTSVARAHLARLRRLGTPLSQRQLAAAAQHPDFAALRGAVRGVPDGS